MGATYSWRIDYRENQNQESKLVVSLLRQEQFTHRIPCLMEQTCATFTDKMEQDKAEAHVFFKFWWVNLPNVMAQKFHLFLLCYTLEVSCIKHKRSSDAG